MVLRRDIIGHMDVFLHVCCADCLLRFLVGIGYPLPATVQPWVRNYRDLPVKNEKMPRFTLIFYNPNIYPKAEYQARLQAVKKLAANCQLPLHILDYRPQDYFALPTSQQQFTQAAYLPARCLACQDQRLQTTLEYIQTKSTSTINFSTTMLASRYLDHQQIRRLGLQLAQNQHAQFWQPEFLTPPDSLHTSGYYKQNYCGCFFSLGELTRRKYQSL